jgi:hypothetical protein
VELLEEVGMGCVASKHAVVHPLSAGSSAGAATIVKQQMVPADVKSASQLDLDKMEAMIAEFEKELDRMSGMVGKAGAAISAANTVIEIVGDAVPVFGGTFHALNKILTAVQRANELADDVVEVGRSAVDYLKLLIKVGRKALDMKGEAKREVNDAIAEVISLLDELSEAVRQFGKPGFVRRMWSAGTKAAKTLKSLDGKIRRKIDEIVKLYDWAKMDGIEAMLTELLKERTFPTEDKILSKVKELVEARMEEETGETEEDARAALEKDEDANDALESVMKESLEQLHAKVDLVIEQNREIIVKMGQLKKEPNKGYWLEVAIEVPPAVFDASARDRAAVARLIQRLESDLIERKEDLRNRQHFPICITDATHRDLDSDLEAGDVNILVWCGLGCDVADCAGSENAVNLKDLKAKLSAVRKKPGLVVVCMKYGARQVAKKLKGIGAAIVWVEADVMSQNSNPERSSAPKKPLLAAVLAEVSSNLARSGSADGLIKEVKAAGGTAGMIVQGHENLPSQLEWEARPEAAIIVPRVSRLPDTRTNIFTSFSEENNEKLKLLACDISRTKELNWEIANAVSKDECPLKRCISSKEVTTDKEAAKAARYRVRAVAFTACNAFMHGGTFEAVYRIDSDDTKETLKEAMESLSQVSSALIWLDLEDEAEDDLLAEIHRLMKRFNRDGKRVSFYSRRRPPTCRAAALRRLSWSPSTRSAAASSSSSSRRATSTRRLRLKRCQSTSSSSSSLTQTRSSRSSIVSSRTSSANPRPCQARSNCPRPNLPLQHRPPPPLHHRSLARWLASITATPNKRSSRASASRALASSTSCVTGCLMARWIRSSRLNWERHLRRRRARQRCRCSK